MQTESKTPSRFLPPDFDKKAPIALIAGQGKYPELVAERIQATGQPLFLFAVGQETSDELIQRFPYGQVATLKVGQLNRLLKLMQRWDIRYSIMAGQITPGRLFRDLRPDWRAFKLLKSLQERNAHTIFGAIVKELQSVGVSPLDARSFLDDQLVDAGDMISTKPVLRAEEEVHAVRVARAMAAEDIGQAVVTARGTVLAVEDFEGTDGLIRRVSSYPAARKIFTKVAKPGHNFSFDVPVLGMRSIPFLKESGIKQLILEADRMLLLEKEQFLAAAAELKIGIRGIPGPV